MSKEIDIGLIEQLASKICHDLISPIGAVNNGIEFLEEMGADAGQEVIDLITYSASQASAKLQAYRMAYGSGGADANIKPEDVHTAIEAVLGKNSKIKQDWDPHTPLGPEERPKGFCKTLISGILLAIECLPKGGTIAVQADGDEGVRIIATGEDACPRGDAIRALDNSMPRESLEPKYVHPYIAGIMARHYGFELSLTEAGDGKVVIAY